MEPAFHCTQQELYSVGRIGYTSVIDRLAQFTAFKAKYVAAFFTALNAEIDAAEALPDEEQRQEDARTFRVVLKTKATEGMAFWQTLKRYITDAYPANEVEIKLDAAGQAHYRKAGKDDWAAVQRLLVDGNTFITDNTADLSAGGNMPAAFATTFGTAKTDYDTAYNDFFNASQNSEVATQTKMIANNTVHSKMMSVFLDGQEIFKNDEAVKKLYTFDQILLTITGPGIAGVRGSIKDSITNLLITSGVTISIFGTDHTTTVGPDGRYEISPVASGTYTIVITCPDYQDQQITNVEIETGTLKTLNIVLVPLP